MKKPLTIIFAIMVFAANTYCACAAAQSPTQTCHAAVAKSPPHCHEAPAKGHGDCHHKPQHHERPSGPDHDSHTCGHCMGTVAADTAKVKSVMSSLDLYPVLFLSVPDNYSASSGLLCGGAFDHSGLPPPLPPPTLLNLSCSFIN